MSRVKGQGMPTAHSRRIDGREHLQVLCWCEAETMWVPSREIAKGLTRHCGRRVCRRADERSRAEAAA